MTQRVKEESRTFFNAVHAYATTIVLYGNYGEALKSAVMSCHCRHNDKHRLKSGNRGYTAAETAATVAKKGPYGAPFSPALLLHHRQERAVEGYFPVYERSGE